MPEHELIVSIRENPGRFPRLNDLLDARQRSEEPPSVGHALALLGGLAAGGSLLVYLGRRAARQSEQLSRREFLSLPTKGKGKPKAVKKQAAGEAKQDAASPSSSPEQPLGRREFLIKSAASTGVLAAGRFADAQSTRGFLLEAQQGINRLAALPEFRQLPPEVQRALLPKAEGFEVNPLMRSYVKTFAEKPHRVVTDSLAQAILSSAAFYGLARLAKQPRKAFLMNYVVGLGSLAIALNNAASAKPGISGLFSAPHLQRELQELHAAHR